MDRGKPRRLLLRPSRSLRDHRNLQAERNLWPLVLAWPARLPCRVRRDDPVPEHHLLRRSCRRGDERRRHLLHRRPCCLGRAVPNLVPRARPRRRTGRNRGKRPRARTAGISIMTPAFGPMDTVVVACCQITPILRDPAANRELVTAAVSHAALLGAGIVVLPELISSGYVFEDQAEVAANAEAADGETLTLWKRLAAHHEIVIVGGFCELAPTGGTVFN